MAALPVSPTRIAVGSTTAENAAARAELAQVRDRLFRMIVANEWDRSHGNRAS